MTLKTMYPITKISKERGYILESDSGEKKMFLPGLIFEQHPPLVLIKAESRDKRIGRIEFKSLKQVIEPGINMKLIKNYNKNCKEYEKVINLSRFQVTYLIKSTSQNLEGFYKYAIGKRKRDLAQIQTLI